VCVCVCVGGGGRFVRGCEHVPNFVLALPSNMGGGLGVSELGSGR
jgi:hypothetical protein